MFVTYNPEGLVTAYSDKERTTLDLQPEEVQVEVDIPFNHIDCKTGGLTVVDGKLLNDGDIIANQI